MIEPVARLRIEIEETSPPVWRVVDVPLSTSLAALHDIIQVAMRWHDEHLYEFEVGDKIYGRPGPDSALSHRTIYKAKSIRLGTLVDRGVRQFHYIYDFGDNWRHRITIEDVRQGDAAVDYPQFVAGARHAPPEDVGGISGFEEFLEAMGDPDHEDHARMIECYGGFFDPNDIDARHVRMIIEDFAARRRGPLMSHRGQARKKADMTGFVYVLGSDNACGYRTYVGWTLDLERRLAQHNSGTGAKSTRGRTWCLIYAERFPSAIEAMRREWQLKRDRLLRRRLALTAQGLDP